jgi:PAS domain S-box-containing protein
VVLVDLTGIKRTEAALAAERERLAVTLRAMAEGVITTEVQGRVLFLNEAACELTGLTATAAIGRLLEEVCVLRHEKSRQALPPLAEAAIRTDLVADLPPRTALFDRTATPRLVEGRCAPIHDLHNQAIGAVLVLRDVTERARLEGEILRASKLESVGVLAGGSSNTSWRWRVWLRARASGISSMVKGSLRRRAASSSTSMAMPLGAPWLERMT